MRAVASSFSDAATCYDRFALIRKYHCKQKKSRHKIIKDFGFLILLLFKRSALNPNSSLELFEFKESSVIDDSIDLICLLILI